MVEDSSDEETQDVTVYQGGAYSSQDDLFAASPSPSPKQTRTGPRLVNICSVSVQHITLWCGHILQILNQKLVSWTS